MRLFVAIFPPKEYLDYMRDITRKFTKQKRNLKLVPTDQLHVTIRYIGSQVSEHSYELIRDELLRLQGSFGKVQLELDKLEFGFEFEHFPKIMHHGVVSHKSLIKVSDDVHSVVQALKLRDTLRRKNRYSDSFHITLARLKQNSTRSTAKLIGSHVKNLQFTKPLPVEITQMQLVESIVGTGVPRYKKLDVIKL